MAALAGSSKPITGYRVSLITGLPRTKVYSELKRSLDSGLVERKGRLYCLVDPVIRALLQKRVRLVWADDWFEEMERREPARQDLVSALQRLPPPKFRRETGWVPHHPESYRRDPEKNTTLWEMKLRTSAHG